jgi:leader peptidase (prepilin peptidase) / N-methyltransferase
MIAALIAGIAGLFLAGVVWHLARRQAARIALFGGDLKTSVIDWLPLWGFGRGPLDVVSTEPRSKWQAIFEVATALYFATLGWRLDFSTDLAMAILFSLPLLMIALVDYWTRLIHVNVIVLGVVFGLLFAIADGTGALVDSLLGMAVGAGIFIAFFVLAMVIYRNPKVVPFGLGDVYLAAMIGAMVRISLVGQALILGIFLAGFILAALLFAKVLTRKQAVAYGPYLCLGALVTMVINS